MNFIVDVNLGRLATWLRILGYNTVVYPGNADRNFLKRTAQEGRVALTRKKNMTGNLPLGKLAVIRSDTVHDQLREVMERLSCFPDPARMFTICSKCNSDLIEVSKEEILGMVPDHIFTIHNEFHMCPHCKGVFWPGSHIAKIQNYLRMRTQSHHP